MNPTTMLLRALAVSLLAGCLFDGEAEIDEPDPWQDIELGLTTTIHVPTDDAYVLASAPAKNNGAYSWIEVGDNSASSVLRFDLQALGAGGASKAILRLYASELNAGVVELRQVTNDAWTQGTVTYSNRPAYGALIKSFTPALGWNQLDVTSFVNAQLAGDDVVSFALVKPSGTRHYFRSREHTSKPALAVDTGGGGASTGSCQGNSGATYFVSPSGSDSNPGTLQSPWRSISKANELKAGDVLRLLPGTYRGQIQLTAVGSASQPITITSHDPANPAVIDGGGNPQQLAQQSSDPNANWPHECFRLVGAKWLNLEHLHYRNCWRNVIIVDNSSYISVRGGVASSGEVVVDPRGANAHHILIEGLSWLGDQRVWTTWDWSKMHHTSGSTYNDSWWIKAAGGQSLYAGGGSSPGGAVIRDCTIRYAFNGINVSTTGSWQESNIEIYRNRFEYLRDNALEPGDSSLTGSMQNWFMYHNDFYQAGVQPISMDWNGGGGPAYFYGNVLVWNPNDASPAPGYTDFSGGVFKFASTNVTNPPASARVLGNRLYIVNNTFLVGAFVQGYHTQAHLRHYNNIYRDPGGTFAWNLSSFSHSAAVDNLFDYDASYPGTSSNPGTHDFVNVDPMFRDYDVVPNNADYRLSTTSPLRNAGTAVSGFAQSYEGSGPDVGAYDEDRRADGPPFVVSGSVPYVEHPRITRHIVSGNTLTLDFSTPLAAATVIPSAFAITQCSTPVAVSAITMLSATRVRITVASPLSDDATLNVRLASSLRGQNGVPATNWASTVGSPFRRF